MNIILVIVNGVLILGAFGMIGVAIYTQHKARKEFFEYIRTHRQIGYIQINADGTTKFVYTKPDGSPLEEK